MNMNMGAASVSPVQQPGRMQVAVIKKSEELQKQNVLQLINSVAGTAPAARPTAANPPGVGQNLDVVA